MKHKIETDGHTLYSTEGLANLLGQSEWAILHWTRDFGLPSMKLGRHRYFDIEKVRAWSEERTSQQGT